jgi:hypothetical protein
MTRRLGLEVDTLTIRIPIRLQRRGGRKLIMKPDGSAVSPPKPSRDETLVRRSFVRTAGGDGSRTVRPSRSPTLRSRRVRDASRWGTDGRGGTTKSANTPPV